MPQTLLASAAVTSTPSLAIPTVTNVTPTSLSFTTSPNNILGTNSTNPCSASSSVSHSKLANHSSFLDDGKHNNVTGNRIMDMDILEAMINDFICPECKQNNVSLKEVLKNKKGLASYLIIYCVCGYEKPFYTSKQTAKSFDVNKRAVYSMRSCGQGYAGLEIFLFCMNMPKTMTRKNYTKISDVVSDACQKTALETMNSAANDLRKTPNDSTDISISNDGSWQRRGYSSMNGFVSTISMDTGKVLDIEAMSRFCKLCCIHEKLRKSNPEEYELWKAKHAATCRANYRVPLQTWKLKAQKESSIDRKIMGYGIPKLFSDGDSKTFPAIQNTYMFGENPVKVVKRECVGHVQKRVGNRIRKKKKLVRGLGGKGKLTENMIDRLQNYYGIAIRSNKGNIEGVHPCIIVSRCFLQRK